MKNKKKKFPVRITMRRNKKTFIDHIKDLYNFIRPIKCSNKYRTHDWEYSYEYIMYGTGEYVNGNEIKRKVEKHVRKCTRCGEKQVWENGIVGWV